MAPKGGRGGGGRGSGSSVSTCPGAFETQEEQASLANDVLFLVIFLLISLAFCSFRKKSGPGKKLIGVPYILALLCIIITFACSMIAQVLNQCGIADSFDYYDWLLVVELFSHLSEWLLLFVVVYQLNAMLRQQLGHFTAIFKIICLGIVGSMAALTIALIGISCYNRWTNTAGGGDVAAEPIVVEIPYRVAYYVLYMVSVLAAGGLALMAVMSHRSRRSPAGDLIGWVVALFAAMFLWSMFAVVSSSINLQDYLNTVSVYDRLGRQTTFIALGYLSNLFFALSFIFILCIAKHACWGHSTIAENTTPYDPHAGMQQQQYAYQAQPSGQQYAYNAQPNGQQYAYNAQPHGQAYQYQSVPANNAPELVK